MTRARGELPEPEESLLGIERPTLEQEDEAKKIADEKVLLRTIYLRKLMDTELFRAWLWEHLQAFGTFTNTFGLSPTGFPHPEGSWFAAGRKSAGWDIWEQIDNLAPDLASLMRREATKPRE